MQHFRDHEKKQLNVTTFGFYFCKIYHGLSLCESLYFVLYAWSSYFALILSCVNIKKLLKMAARPTFIKLFAPKS